MLHPIFPGDNVIPPSRFPSSLNKPFGSRDTETFAGVINIFLSALTSTQELAWKVTL